MERSDPPATGAAALRAKAALCRRAAEVPTDGGRGTDRILINLAEQLEREATELEKR